MERPPPALGPLLDENAPYSFGVDFTPAIQREGRASAVAQQPFQALAFGPFNAHAGVERKAAPVLPTRHRLGIFRLKHTAPGRRAQQTAADLGLDLVEQLLVGGTAFVKRRRS